MRLRWRVWHTFEFYFIPGWLSNFVFSCDPDYIIGTEIVRFFKCQWLLLIVFSGFRRACIILNGNQLYVCVWERVILKVVYMFTVFWLVKCWAYIIECLYICLLWERCVYAIEEFYVEVYLVIIQIHSY